MTTSDWPAGDPRLERHYRRLLLAHSGRYRRDHGTEIVTTLMEMAEPGRSRPSAGETWHLIASGLRQRFRLPQRPLVLLTAVLVAAATAVLGAAGGSWAGERTFTSLPSQATVQRLLTAAVPDADPSRNLPPFRMSVAGNADRYSIFATPATRHPGADPARIATAVRDRITAAGWTVTSFTVIPPAYEDLKNSDAGTEFTAADFRADHDGLILRGSVFYDYDGGQFYPSGLSASLFAQRAAAYLPLTIAGGILGLGAGWLLVAALAYRLRSMPTGRRRTASVLTGAALVMAGPPVFAIARQAVVLAIHFHDTRFAVFTLHSVVREGSSVDGPPRWLIPACTIAAAAFGALATAVCLSRDAPAPATPPRLAGAGDDR
ncbi:hypothetical protein [Actinoplanes sp. NPDC051411]|uniref:hypothetical protein n=1 Tax=Actinoplanes sp. NPDC051411 TaxID=3155522 RepID=UPI00342E43CC